MIMKTQLNAGHSVTDIGQATNDVGNIRQMNTDQIIIRCQFHYAHNWFLISKSAVINDNIFLTSMEKQN